MKKRPYIISGPCSAETEEQLLKTAKQLVKYSSIDCLRAGIWKPRTRPNSFEGVGETGLQWLKKAGNAVNLPVTTEVANTNHVELALKNNISKEIGVFFIQKDRGCISLNMNSIPFLACNGGENINPYACCAGVLASFTVKPIGASPSAGFRCICVIS